jgi:hypothetical protein
VDPAGGLSAADGAGARTPGMDDSLSISARSRCLETFPTSNRKSSMTPSRFWRQSSNRPVVLSKALIHPSCAATNLCATTGVEIALSCAARRQSHLGSLSVKRRAISSRMICVRVHDDLTVAQSARDASMNPVREEPIRLHRYL